MTKLEIFKEMIGESHAEFVADSLKETYYDLMNEKHLIKNEASRNPIWSYEDDEEQEELNKMLDALELVYSWYSCGNINKGR